MASLITRFDIKKFDGKNDFGLWQIKMRALMIQQGCDDALEALPADMKAGKKAALMKKAYSTLILCLETGFYDKLPRKQLLQEFERNEFNKLILDLANIDIEIEDQDQDQALMLLMSLPSSYENFMRTLLYGRESLTMEDVLATLNLRVLKKRTEGTKEEIGDGLYVRGRLDNSGKAHSGRSSWFKSRGGTCKLKCFICHSEGHLKRDYPMKKSSGFVTSNGEGGSYHMTHMRDFLYDFKGFDGGSVQLGDNKTCTIKGTRKDEKRVWFEVELQGAQGNREAEIFQVSNDDATVAQRWLGDKKPEEKTNMDCLLKEQENVHLGIKVRTKITVTGVPSQEGAKGNVAEKKKMEESKKTNLGKLLKYNAWSKRWSPDQGSSTRKRC
ncbi:hypothetical protein Tco_1305666 [Tanacetum coccineum]